VPFWFVNVDHISASICEMIPSPFREIFPHGEDQAFYLTLFTAAASQLIRQVFNECSVNKRLFRRERLKAKPRQVILVQTLLCGFGASVYHGAEQRL